MAQSTFNNPQLWLDTLTSSNEQSLNETDKRKWSTLGDLTQPFVKHFNNESDSDLLPPPGKQSDDVLDSNLSPSELRQKRKEQNRVAQRAFRERKERYVKELEDKVSQLEESRINETKQLQEENQALRLQVKQMETEIYTLKGAEQAFRLSIQKLREAGIQLPADTTPATTSNPAHDSTLSSILSPSDQFSVITTPSSSTLETTPTHNSSAWYTSPNINSSPYSASSNSMTSTSSSPLDQSTDRPIYDDSDHGSAHSAKKASDKQQPEHLSASRLSHPPHNSSGHSATDDTALHKDMDFGFATSETDRFDHQPDPLVLGGAKTIPYTQIWEKVQDHPKYELFDMDLLCDDLKKKARCSGFGAVILEEDFIKILAKYDA